MNSKMLGMLALGCCLAVPAFAQDMENNLERAVGAQNAAIAAAQAALKDYVCAQDTIKDSKADVARVVSEVKELYNRANRSATLDTLKCFVEAGTDAAKAGLQFILKDQSAAYVTNEALEAEMKTIERDIANSAADPAVLVEIEKCAVAEAEVITLEAEGMKVVTRKYLADHENANKENAKKIVNKEEMLNMLKMQNKEGTVKFASTRRSPWTGDTWLITAIKKGDENWFDEFLEMGHDVMVADKAGRTPFMWASYLGYAGMAKKLIERGGDRLPVTR